MDPPKGTAKDSLQTLKRSNIELKIVTGDNDVVTRKVCEELGFDVKRVVLGSEMVNMTEDALDRVVEEANIFARVTPIQKDRIIAALKRNGHVVGFLGDGINDASSMRLADVGISVENAVDVAKESADIILLHKDLRVLHEGVLDGRKTFANTMKYIMLGLSSNFGNMFSVAIGSLFLPFLPMLPTQILLNNFLYDLSQSTLPTDNVDQEYVQKPKKLDIRFIRDFMIFFGPISSLFDLLTYAVMLLVFHATAPIFQAAWFIESLSTQTLVIYMIRTRKPFFKSRPSALLVLSGLGVVGFGLLLPLTVLGPIFKFEPLPGAFYIILAAMVVTYLFMVEVLKGWFYKRHPL
jgi:Mg2+-importing ATPase